METVKLVIRNAKKYAIFSVAAEATKVLVVVKSRVQEAIAVAHLVTQVVAEAVRVAVIGKIELVRTLNYKCN
jgi:hypothetical protein